MRGCGFVVWNCSCSLEDIVLSVLVLRIGSGAWPHGNEAPVYETLMRGNGTWPHENEAPVYETLMRGNGTWPHGNEAPVYGKGIQV